MSGWDAVALVVAVFWLGLLANRGRSWPRELRLPSPIPNKATETIVETTTGPAAPGPSSPQVAVIIPARNEADQLPDSLPPLLGQTQHLAQVVLVDDNSTDGTAATAQRVAASVAGGKDKLRVVKAPPPAEGWTGKLHALQCGLLALESPPTQPAPQRPDETLPQPLAGNQHDEKSSSKRDAWLLFTDADILHPSDSLARLLEQARRGDYDLVSVMVRLRAQTFWEKVLIPPFVYFFQLMYPFRSVANPQSRVAAAAGGCILLRRSVLESSGGLEAMKSALIDDVTLARRIKDAGGRCWLGLESEMTSLRGYDRLGDIVDMVARTAFTELRYRYSAVIACWTILGLFFVGPPLLALLAALAVAPWAVFLTLSAWCIQAISLRPVVAHHGVGSWFSFTLPLASFLYACMTTISAWRHWRGRGVRWRDRIQATS